MKTDVEWLEDVLRDGNWHSLNELLRRSLLERGCGLTVHSRVSDLRKKGRTIEWERIPGRQRSSSRYRLVVGSRPSEHAGFLSRE